MEYRELGRTGWKVPVLGQGTWGIGGFHSRDDSRDSEAIAALRLGIELGMTLIDTAEAYGAGHSEEVVGKAIAGLKAEVFVATKVSPEHLSYESVIKSAKASLSRLNIKTIDLYQVHWPNPRIPIKETMRAMERLVKDGLVRFIGVSNFSVSEMEEAMASLAREEIVSNQVEYSLLERSIEHDLLPFCEREKITVIAYSPLARGKLSEPKKYLEKHKADALQTLADKYGKTPSQIALNWVVRRPSVIAIPKAMKLEHVKENAGSVGWSMDSDDYDVLSRAFSRSYW
ncbi:MAG: aldo/keto reductase [Thaumarchaeota archaeon]|nr:aldo/keto reductase [Candidatus Terraquivivens yellowstonensis]MCL7392739.1 aldo/keto reductase [Candidatus Terraquivivens yellowstonensis]MCL7395174.1 aldo/keto reductase [Candidatus Terraquivivens yellowstonensis]MCL7398402.1 aldo/keto reductase [Candidatus Terraquivivens yellowstonensis]MCL7398707.1 aldo/keto reductase [Candidatus Terraquivivens yellowstonensis]